MGDEPQAVGAVVRQQAEIGRVQSTELNTASFRLAVTVEVGY
jgi:hypothetical protein